MDMKNSLNKIKRDYWIIRIIKNHVYNENLKNHVQTKSSCISFNPTNVRDKNILTIFKSLKSCSEL